MNKTHLHFNVATAVWTYIAMLVVGQMARFALNKWQVKGLTDIVNVGP